MSLNAFRREVDFERQPLKGRSTRSDTGRERQGLPRPAGPRRGASERYRTLFELAPDGYLATDRAGRIEEANRSAGVLLRAKQAALVDKPLASFICPEDRGEFRSRLTRLRRSGRRGIEEWQTRLQPPGAEAFDAALTVARVAAGDRRIGLVWALRDISKRKRMERKLKDSEQRYLSLYRQMQADRDRLRILSARSLHAKEEEAKRIAHQLHDEAGQVTASVHLALAEIDRELRPAARPRLEDVRALLEGLEERLRRLSHELRPTILDDLGLGPALEFLAEGFSARTGIAIAVEDSTQKRLDPRLETTLYRIVQEALSNVARHARAKRASIHVRREGADLRCSIRDDGIGIAGDPVAREGFGRRGLGLLGIRERLDLLGGTMEIRSRPRGGTELLASVPLRRRR